MPTRCLARDSFRPAVSTAQLALWLCLLSGAAVASDGRSLGPVTQVLVSRRGHDGSEAAQACQSFSLSASGARAFLRRASVITAAERHYEFLWSPCFVAGSAVVGHRRAQWRIESLGVGVLRFEDGQEVLLGDERQRDRGGR